VNGMGEMNMKLMVMICLIYDRKFIEGGGVFIYVNSSLNPV
jgi:hypothetical protein